MLVFIYSYTRVSLSVRTDNEVLRYRYKRGVSLSVHSPGLVISTFHIFVPIKRPGPGPLYQYICTYKEARAWLNFVPIVNHSMYG